MRKKILFIHLLMIAFIRYSAAEESLPDNGGWLAESLSYRRPVRKSEDEKKWFLNLFGGYTEKSGNTESVNTSFGGSARYDNNITELKLSYSGSYGKYKDVVNDNRGTATGNFDHYIFWRFEFFSYTMSDYNRITLLAHRNGSGAGLKFSFLKNRYLLLDISGAPIFQYEKFEEQEADKEWRWSVRGRAQVFPANDDFSIRYYIFYIPKIDDRKIYRTVQEVTLEMKIAGPLGLKCGYLYEYNTYNSRAFQENPLLKKKDTTAYIQASLKL